jgi:hypothetical protein
MGLIPGPGKAPVEGGDLRSCSVVFLFSETAPEEPFAAAEGGIDMGLIGKTMDGLR